MQSAVLCRWNRKFVFCKPLANIVEALRTYSNQLLSVLMGLAVIEPNGCRASRLGKLHECAEFNELEN